MKILWKNYVAKCFIYELELYQSEHPTLKLNFILSYSFILVLFETRPFTNFIYQI
jgi:hypothetical protein